MGQGPPGPAGPAGAAGVDGKDVNLSDVISSTQFKSDIQNALIKDVSFKNTITDYFKTNATLFKGQTGITEFSKLTDAEKASVVTMLVKNNITIFASQLAADQTFKDSIIATLKTMTDLKGAPGKDGVTEDILKPKVMWCADGNICNVPASATGIQLSNKIMNFGDSSIYATKGVNSTTGSLNISGKENIDFLVNGKTIYTIDKDGFKQLGNVSGKSFEGDAFGNKDKSAFKTGSGSFQAGTLRTPTKFSDGWKKEVFVQGDKEEDVVNTLSKDGLQLVKGNVNIKYGNVLAKSLQLQNLPYKKDGSITVSDAGNVNFISPGNYYFKTGGKDGKETTWLNDNGVTTNNIYTNNICDKDNKRCFGVNKDGASFNGVLRGDGIGYNDYTKFRTGWGGFEAGYIKEDGSWVNDKETNYLNRDNLVIRRGNINVKDWTVSQNNDKNFEIYREDGDVVVLKKGGLRIADWRIWQNGDGNLEFKNEKNNKWAIFKKDGGWSQP